MNHDEIRFRILHDLYQKYYSGGLLRYYSTDSVIKESGLGDIDINIVLGDVLYLKNKGLIRGMMVIGTAYPIQISIESHGIDTLENFVTRSVNTITSSDLDINSKQEVEEIKKEENVQTKIKKWYNFVISRPELSYIQEALRAYFGSGAM